MFLVYHHTPVTIVRPVVDEKLVALAVIALALRLNTGPVHLQDTDTALEPATTPVSRELASTCKPTSKLSYNQW